MTLSTMDGKAHARFEEICATVSARGRGLTLAELGDAAALAREEAKDEPSPERMAFFRRRLGLEEEDE